MSRKLNPSIFLRLDATRDNEELLFGSGFDGYVYQIETGTTDDGDVIEARWKTGWLDFGIPETQKIYKHIHINVERLVTPLSIDWNVDHGVDSGTLTARMNQEPGYVWGAPNQWGTPDVWGAGGDIQKKRMIMSFTQPVSGQAIQLSFNQLTSTDEFQITSYSILFEIMETFNPVGDI